MNQARPLNSRRSAYTAIVLLGIVSLFGDIVYEGSRGLVPDYLAFLGASALVVGLVGGAGDLVGYAIRLVSGVIVDATRAYWLFIFVGYFLIVAIPLLGLSGGLALAIVLVMLERLGKALRQPSRDTVLSVVSEGVGSGKAFGLHELLDQVGAIIGPSIVTGLMFYTGNNYSLTFGSLFVPFLLVLATLAVAYSKIRSKTPIKPPKTEVSVKDIPKPFYFYAVAVLVNAVGLIPFSLVLFKVSLIVLPLRQDWIVPLVFVLIQGVDAPSALLSGYAYDRFGMKFLLLPFVLSVFPPLFAMVDAGLLMLVVASVFFGIVLGMQESVYRAAVSDLAPFASRGTAYGIFNAAYGFGLLISGAVYGLMISYALPFILVLLYAVIMQAISIMLLISAYKRQRATVSVVR
jgi:MFS family permease